MMKVNFYVINLYKKINIKTYIILKNYSFSIILELLALQISPEDIYILLKQICSQSTENQASDNPEEV